MAAPVLSGSDHDRLLESFTEGARNIPRGYGNRQLCIRRSDWNGQVTSPKGGRLRHVPMTKRLAAALSSHRHLRSAHVLCQDYRQPLTRQIVQTRAKRASARRAGLREKGGSGGVHNPP